MCWVSWNLGASTSWNHHGLSRPVMGLLYLFRWTAQNLKFFTVKLPSLSYYVLAFRLTDNYPHHSASHLYISQHSTLYISFQYFNMCFTLLSSSVSIRSSSSRIFPSDAYNIFSILSSIVWSRFLSLVMLDINSFRSCSKSGCSTSTTSLKVKIQIQINKFIHCVI